MRFNRQIFNACISDQLTLFIEQWLLGGFKACFWLLHRMGVLSNTHIILRTKSFRHSPRGSPTKRFLLLLLLYGIYPNPWLISFHCQVCHHPIAIYLLLFPKNTMCTLNVFVPIKYVVGTLFTLCFKCCCEISCGV